MKLLYLELRIISQRWMMPIQNWKHAMVTAYDPL